MEALANAMGVGYFSGHSAKMNTHEKPIDPVNQLPKQQAQTTGPNNRPKQETRANVQLSVSATAKLGP